MAVSDNRPTVSAIIIFLDEARFLAEAIDSVATQTYTDWELLLVDDGSTDGSTDIARNAAAADPTRVRYLEHDDHQNRGMSASRNLGIAEARGRYVASLDGDDRWLPNKLALQVAAMERHPEVAMTYSPLLRWRTWTGDPTQADHEDLMGVGRRKYGRHRLAGQVVAPPNLVPMILSDDYYIPGGALIRRDVLQSVGCYEDSFRGMYEDAVVMIKIALAHPVLVGEEIHYLYRMHDESHTSRVSGGQVDPHRRRYLQWIEQHIETEGLGSPRLRMAMAKAKRSTHRRRHVTKQLLTTGRAVGRAALPRSLRDRLRARWRDHTRPLAGER